MTDNVDNMRLTNVFAIRDARGLTLAEKTFLLLVESRGTYTRSAENAYEEMCMSRKLFDKTRKSLEARRLIFVKRFPKAGRHTKPNQYRVNIAEVLKLIPAALPEEEAEWTTGLTEQDHVPSAQDHVPTAHDRVPPAHEGGPRDATKRTNKRTSEEDLEDHQEEKSSQGTKGKDILVSESSSGLIVDDPGLSVPDPLAVVVTPVGSPGAAVAEAVEMPRQASESTAEDLKKEQRIRYYMEGIEAGNKLHGIKHSPEHIRKAAEMYYKNEMRKLSAA